MLAGIVGASVQGRVALGQRAGAQVRRLGDARDTETVTSRGARQAHLEGFDLHANVWVSGNDRAGLERLARYIVRPPFAQERLRVRGDGRVALDHAATAASAPHMIVLDALLAVGVLLNVVNGARLLLGPEGRQTLAAWTARVADRLESARPIRRLEPLVTGRRRTRLWLIGVGEFVIALAADMLVDYWDGSLDAVGSFGALLYAAAIAASVAALPLLNRLGEPQLMRWLLGDERFWPFLRRFVQFCVIGVAIIAAYQGALWGAGVLLGVGNLRTVVALAIDRVGPMSALLGVGLVLGAPPLVYYSIISQLGASAVLLTALAWVGARLLTLVHGAAASMLRDNKGAWAAGVLAATIGLGILRLALTGGLGHS